MNSEHEHELLTSARILALLSQEKNILRKRPSLAGENLRETDAQLETIRAERAHLLALQRQDPKAIAAEEARLREVDLAFAMQAERAGACWSRSDKHRDTGAIQHAEFAVADYIGSEQSAEYSYTETFNPEGRPAGYFHEQARLARTDMMEALAALSDADAEQVLARKPRVDHDGETFPAAAIQEVRAYRAVLTGHDDPAHAVSEADRQAAAADIRDKAVSKAVADLSDAISWGDEGDFHDAFEAISQNPAIDATAIAKVITGREHETREAALGAIETAFHATQASLQQTATRVRGR